MLAWAIFIPSGRGPLAERIQHCIWGYGGTRLAKLIFVKPIAHTKFWAIFIPSTVRTGQVVGERKEEHMERLALTPWTVDRPVDRPVDRSVDRVFL